MESNVYLNIANHTIVYNISDINYNLGTLTEYVKYHYSKEEEVGQTA